MTTDDRDALALPRRNPVPLIAAGIVAAAILAGLGVVLLGDGDSSSEPVVISTGEGRGTIPSAALLGEPAPEATFTDFEGTEQALADYQGRPLVLNFFASWCSPCVAEMPDLETVSREHAEEVGFLGLNVQDTVEDGRSIVTETGITYPVGRDPDGSILAQFRGITMPTTVFLDAEGTVVRVHAGQVSADNLRQIIEQDLLG